MPCFPSFDHQFLDDEECDDDGDDDIVAPGAANEDAEDGYYRI